MKRIMILIGIVVVVLLVALSMRPRPLAVEFAEVSEMTVREYVTEDAKTRLGDEYVIDMPISGTVDRIELEVGDYVENGETIAQIDTFVLEQGILGVEALIDQAQAQIDGVDATKPKSEDLDSAVTRVQERKDAILITERGRRISEIDYEKAEKDYIRVKTLFKDGAISQATYDEIERIFNGASQALERAKLSETSARKTLRIAELASSRVVDSVDDNEYLRKSYQAETEKLNARLAELKRDLEKTEIVAPVSGPLLDKYVEDRRVLVAGTPLLKLGDLSSIEIEADILSEEVGQIREGNQVDITGKALSGKAIQGIVKKIYPAGFKKISALGIEQQRVKIIISFDNANPVLRPGTRVDVRIITEEHENVLAIPERSTFRRENKWNVFAVRDNKAVLTPVTIGLKNDDWIEILDGLKRGELVVAEPTNDLTDGKSIINTK